MYFAYCYRVRSLCGPVVEDEEGETPRSPTPKVLPIGRRGVLTAPLIGGAGRNPEANRVVVACPVMLPQLPVGLHRVVSLLALAVGRKVSATGTTGGGPKWDQVIWRRTVDANGTVIKDIGVNSGDRRATLFRMLPRRTDIKTTFWYCDDAEVMLSCRSKYFQKGPDREPLRVKIPDLPDVFVVSVESDNTGRVVSRCREAGYSHPNAIKFPSRKRIAGEVQSAPLRQ